MAAPDAPPRRTDLRLLLRVALRCTIRVLLVATAWAFATFVPYFAETVCFVGALGVSTLVYVLPPLFAFRLRRMRRLERCWAALIVACGLATAVFGTLNAMEEIATKLRRGDPWR